jgi:hypothetical protein
MWTWNDCIHFDLVIISEKKEIVEIFRTNSQVRMLDDIPSANLQPEY